MGENALCFGGGGLVGTAEALGHLVGLDQVIRDSSTRKERKRSFFDYMTAAGVPIRHLDSRLDDVMALIPEDEKNGERDYLHRYFNVISGISGGSFLAAAVASERSMVELIVESLTFPLSTYFHPDYKEFIRGLSRMPAIPLRLATKLPRAIDLTVLLNPRKWFTPAAGQRLARLGFEALAAWEVILPRGFLSGEGIEKYLNDMCVRTGVAGTFEEVRNKGKWLYIISDQFDRSKPLAEGDSTVVYFGDPPYDKVPISKAIRASSSIPGITTPMEIEDLPNADGPTLLVDGAIAKTLGRKRIFDLHDIDLMISVNPIIPFDGPLNSFLDIMEQLYRKLTYSRLKGVTAYIDEDVKDRIINIESRPEEFFFNMFRIDKMKQGLFEGYYQTLKLCAENYLDISKKLKRGGLCMIPRNEIFRLVMGNANLRERAYIISEDRMEKEQVSFFNKIASKVLGKEKATVESSGVEQSGVE